MSRFVGPVVAAIPESRKDFALRGLAIYSGRRVPGMAAEAAFWVVFSLPWLSLALMSGLAYVSQYFVDDPVDALRTAAQDVANRVLTPEAASQYATPMINDFFNATRPDLGFIGLILAIWAGSRAVMTYVDAIMVINGEYDKRGYVRRRLLSVVLYVCGALICIVLLPLIVIGPQRIGTWLDSPSWVVSVLYFVMSVAAAFILLVFLFHFAAKERIPLRTNVPGALIAVGACALASLVLTVYVRRLFLESSVYGVLAAPIALMIFAYVMSLMVLIGAIYNAVRTDRAVFRSAADPEGRFARSNQALDRWSGAAAKDATSQPDDT